MTPSEVHTVKTPRFAVLAAATAAAIAAASPMTAPATAEEIGYVDSAFKLLGPNHKIVVEAIDDPRVPGVSCWISRPVAGGLKGAVGLAEDPSTGAIACRQVGPVSVDLASLPDREEVFSERTSVFFKERRVIRMVDVKRNTLVYLTYSTKLIDGSPQSSISTVVVGGGF